MNIERIEIENFLTIGHIIASLDNKGLVLVQGENQDDTSQNSNGAGKSSFPDALSWCLFGTTARGESGDNVVNAVEGKNCRVGVVIRDGKDRYRVIRHRKFKKSNRLVVFKFDGKVEMDITAGTDKLTQEVVNRIVGCSEEVFNAAIYAGQERMPDLPAMTDKHLKGLVEEAAGVDRLQQGYEIARKKLNEAKGLLDQNERDLDRNKAKIDDAEETLDRVTKQRDEWSDERNSRIDDAKNQAYATKSQYGVAKKKLTDMNESAVGSELKVLEEKLDAVADEQTERDRLKGEQDAAGLFVKDTERNLKRQMEEVERRKRKMSEVEGGVGQPCDECGRDHTRDSLKSAIEAAKNALKNTAVDAKRLKMQLEKARKQLESASEQFSAFVDAMTDVSQVRARQRVLRESENDIAAQKAEVDRLATKFRQEAERIKEIRAEENPHDKTIAYLDKNLKEYRSARGLLDQGTKRLEYDVQVAEAVSHVFSPAGVRAHILDTVTPFLNGRTSHYLSTLSDGNINATWSTLSKTAKGELREKFVIEVESAVGGKKFGSLSGGEKRKVRLACSMALQDLVASRAVKPFNLYIADEVDQAVDVSGLERLMTILSEKAKERGTVLVISHTDLKSWISDEVTIVKKGGKAELSGMALA